MEPFRLEPCCNGRGLEAIPGRDLGLDLARLAAHLRSDGWQVRLETEAMIMVKRRHEATIFQNGRVLVTTLDVTEALGVVETLAPALDACGAVKLKENPSPR